VPATVTRQISYLDSAGNATSAHAPAAAGWLLQGTFTITYQVNGKQYSQSLTVVRSVR